MVLPTDWANKLCFFGDIAKREVVPFSSGRDLTCLWPVASGQWPVLSSSAEKYLTILTCLISSCRPTFNSTFNYLLPMSLSWPKLHNRHGIVRQSAQDKYINNSPNSSKPITCFGLGWAMLYSLSSECSDKYSTIHADTTGYDIQPNS